MNGLGMWKKVWKLEVIERVRFFAWQIIHGRLLTKKNPYCQHCPGVEESITHVLRDCPIAAFLWRHLIEVENRSKFFGCDLVDWVNLNMNGEMGKHHELPWISLWATACYCLWK